MWMRIRRETLQKMVTIIAGLPYGEVAGLMHEIDKTVVAIPEQPEVKPNGAGESPAPPEGGDGETPEKGKEH